LPPGGARPVQGDGDLLVGEGDPASDVQQISGDRSVLVVVGQICVEVAGKVQPGVVSEQAAHHLQCPCREAGLGPLGIRVEPVGRELGRDAFEAVLLKRSARALPREV